MPSQRNLKIYSTFVVFGFIVLVVLSSGSFQFRAPKAILNDSTTKLTMKNQVRSRGYPSEEGWWTPWLPISAHTYQPRNEDNFDWCFPTDQSPERPPRSEIIHGLLYIKSHKASSSTCAGVNMAIAHHVAERKFAFDKDSGDTMCEHYDRHKFHRDKSYAYKRDRNHSLLWTLVRHPAARDISQLYHFQITRKFKDPNKDTEYLLQVLENYKGQQTRFLSLRSNDIAIDDGHSVNFEQQLSTALRTHIFEKYDFIGIVERMTESLAVMTLLWNLEPTDVIVLSAKQANGDTYDDGRYENTCFKIVSPPRNFSELQPRLSSYIQSQSYVTNNTDFLLYYAAQESLDRTIEAIGIETVRERAALIKKLQVLAEDTCQKEAIYPCSKNGVHQAKRSAKNCYINDSGCAYACVDRLMSAYRSGNVALK